LFLFHYKKEAPSKAEQRPVSLHLPMTLTGLVSQAEEGKGRRGDAGRVLLAFTTSVKYISPPSHAAECMVLQ